MFECYFLFYFTFLVVVVDAAAVVVFRICNFQWFSVLYFLFHIFATFLIYLRFCFTYSHYFSQLCPYPSPSLSLWLSFLLFLSSVYVVVVVCVC